MRKVVAILSPMVLMVASNPSHAFNFNKIIQGVKEQTAPKSFGQDNKSSSSSSALSAFVNAENICRPAQNQRDNSFYNKAAGPVMEQWRSQVAADFGLGGTKEGAANTATILVDHFHSGDGLKWALDYDIYLKSFKKKVFADSLSAFARQPENRLEIAAKFRRAIEDKTFSRAKRDEARFAYALILARYDSHHSNQGLTESFLKEAAAGDESLGALYVLGKRMYLGLDFPKNVKAADSLVYRPVDVIEEMIAEAEDRGDDAPDVTKWNEPKKLWDQYTGDPESGLREKYPFAAKYFDEAQAKAAKMKADLESGASKGPLKKYEGFLAKSQKMRRGLRGYLIEAFGAADELAKETNEFITLKNMSNPDAQVIEKTVAMEDDIDRKLAQIISEKTEKLGPKGLEKAELAYRGTTTVINDMVKYVQMAFADMQPLLFSGDTVLVGQFTASIRDFKKLETLTCELYTAIDDYKARTEITFTNEKPLEIGSDEEALLLNAS